MKNRICMCGAEFSPTNNRQKYCSEQCRVAQYKPKVAHKGIAPNTVGAIQELRVAADLLAKGFEVFRAMSPACSTDLIAQKNKQLLRIEVRTGYYRPGGVQFAKDHFRSDHFAVVLPDQIIYLPPIGE